MTGASNDFVKTADGEPGFLNTIITGDKSWCFWYDPEKKTECRMAITQLTKKGSFPEIMHKNHADHILQFQGDNP
jgi:hypothetical protein